MRVIELIKFDGHEMHLMERCRRWTGIADEFGLDERDARLLNASTHDPTGWTRFRLMQAIVLWERIRGVAMQRRSAVLELEPASMQGTLITNGQLAADTIRQSMDQAVDDIDRLLWLFTTAYNAIHDPPTDPYEMDEVAGTNFDTPAAVWKAEQLRVAR